MRFGMVLATLSLSALLSACVLGGGKGDAPSSQANPITGDAIATTSLDANPAAADQAPPSRPEVAKPAPAANPPAASPPAASPTAADEATEAPLAEVPEEAAAPKASLSPEALKCVKAGGNWAGVGKSGAKACIKSTRDAGKACTKQTQCEGFCLARSGTCAPITPMFGCNDILQADGRRVTLCID